MQINSGLAARSKNISVNERWAGTRATTSIDAFSSAFMNCFQYNDFPNTRVVRSAVYCLCFYWSLARKMSST